MDGVADDAFHRSTLYDAKTIKRLMEKLIMFEKATKNNKATKKMKGEANTGARKDKQRLNPRTKMK